MSALPLSSIKEPAGAAAEFKAIKLKIDAALKAVRALFGPQSKQHAKLAGEVQHKYDDKFAVAEFVVCSALGVFVNSLAALGIDCAKVVAARAGPGSGAVAMQFFRKHTCKFVQKLKRRSRDSLTAYYEAYEWEVACELTVSITVADKTVSELKRICSTLVDSNTDNPPQPTCATFQPYVVDLTGLFDHLSCTTQGAVTPTFHIGREACDCFTPMHNKDVKNMLKTFEEFRKHQEKVAIYFCDTLYGMEPKRTSQQLLDDVGSVSVNPVLPVLQVKGGAVQLSQLLKQHEASLKEHAEWLSQKVASQGLMSYEALLILSMVRHNRTTCRHVVEALTYLCDLARNQLVQAVGGVLRTRDLQRYMNNFHFQYARMAEQYQPKPFCYVVRSEGRPQEGEVRITDTCDEPACSFVRSFPLPRNVSCPLTPATSVKLSGTAFLHAHVAHAFGPYSELGRKKDGKQFELQLHATARQFSCFVVLLGSVRAGNEFVTEHAVVVQNKDELVVPLQISVLPSTKDFYDRITTLAPAQQDFAKAYRRMHLQGSIFGFCVVPVKDALEKLLGLPPHCLKREVQLTQHLLTLMMDCQLPGDLFAFESDDEDVEDVEELTAAHKLEQVRRHVSALLATLRGDKKQTDDKEEDEKRGPFFSANSHPPPPHHHHHQPVYHHQHQQQPNFGLGQQMQHPQQPPQQPPQQQPNFGVGQQMQQQQQQQQPNFGVGRQPPQQQHQDQWADDSVTEDEEPMEESRKKEQEETANGKYDDANLPSIVPALESVLEAKKDYGLRGGTVKALKTRTWSRKGYAATGLEVSSKEHVNYIKLMAEGTVEKRIHPTQQAAERNRAFDLLDALSSSGALPLENVKLHIFFSFVHFFDASVLDTVVNDGVNPVAKLHASSLSLASLVHKVGESTLCSAPPDAPAAATGK